jgi:hypothetical protein
MKGGGSLRVGESVLLGLISGIFWGSRRFLVIRSSKLGKSFKKFGKMWFRWKGIWRFEIYPSSKCACELKCLVFTLNICFSKWSLMDVKGDYWSGGKVKIFSFSPKFGEKRKCRWSGQEVAWLFYNLPQSFGDTSSIFYFAMIHFDCWIIIVIYALCANAHGFAIQILAR